MSKGNVITQIIKVSIIDAPTRTQKPAYSSSCSCIIGSPCSYIAWIDPLNYGSSARVRSCAYQLPIYALFQLFADLKMRHAFRGDFDLVAVAGVTSGARRAMVHVKRAEATNLN